MVEGKYREQSTIDTAASATIHTQSNRDGVTWIVAAVVPVAPLCTCFIGMAHYATRKTALRPPIPDREFAAPQAARKPQALAETPRISVTANPAISCNFT